MNDELEFNEWEYLKKNQSLDTEERKKPDLQETENLQKRLVNQVEEMEKGYKQEEKGIKELWSSARKNILTAHNGKEITGIKKQTYDLLEKVGINMYERESNKHLDIAQKKVDIIKNKLEGIEYKLKIDSDGGITKTLEEQKDMAETTANALVQSKILLEKYDLEVTNLEKDIGEQTNIARNNLLEDYQPEMNYLIKRISEIKEKRKGVNRTINHLETKIESYDSKIKTKNKIKNTMELVYHKGLSAYRDLESGIEISREFVKTGKFVREGLGETMKDLEEVLEMTKWVKGAEQIMGNALVESTKRIDQSMEKLGRHEGNNDYLQEIEIQTNFFEQKKNKDMDSIIKEYATIPYN